MSSISNSLPLDILDFWWQAGPESWFKGGSDFDSQIQQKFSKAVEAACEGELDHWTQSPHSTLALLLLLDQFTRNIYRGSARAFSGDEKALVIAEKSLQKGDFRAFNQEQRAFFFLPFEHSEKMEHQDLAVDLFRKYCNEQNYLYALVHMDVIRRFNRFPHRNEALERVSTPEEVTFLEEGGFRA
ncbi:DUF924 family protein [Flexibacterium corallicola]|uniref:DUF924 family protein n=1 Tax=Flexibacterium corallicola TaxID=3037259 RepID=UPI00286EC6F4|nr:DUF924 family protein [Pseudovibrio sp. M1P-2-3]